MAKNRGKRSHHRQESDSVNRTALLIGGAVAAGILAVVIGSALM